MVMSLVAQCAGTAPCELPTGLPWYFGILLAAIWLGAIVGAAAIGLRLLRRRQARREDRVGGPRQIESPSPGTDLERW